MLNTVNQLFLATTLFCDLPEINWFAVTYFHDQDANYLKNKIPDKFENWFTARKICDEEAFACKSRENFSYTNKSWFTVFTKAMT